MNKEELKYQEAKKRVNLIKRFYLHLIIYSTVNIFLLIINVSQSSKVIWFYWPLLGWGIAIAIHAAAVFGLGRLFRADWEAKKIKEIMDKDKKA